MKDQENRPVTLGDVEKFSRKLNSVYLRRDIGWAMAVGGIVTVGNGMAGLEFNYTSDESATLFMGVGMFTAFLASAIIVEANQAAEIVCNEAKQRGLRVKNGLVKRRIKRENFQLPLE